MKTTTLSLAALSLMQLAAAQPHRIHRHAHPKRDVVVTEVVVTTVTAPNVIVWVDEYGNPVSTVTEGQPAPTEGPVVVEQSQTIPTPAPAPPAAPVAPQPAAPQPEAPAPEPAPKETPKVEVPQPDPPKVEAAASTPSSAPPAIQPAAQSSTSDVELPLGVTYSVMKGSYPGQCKTADEVAADVKTIEGAGFTRIRLYGLECNGIQNVIAAAGPNTKVMAGLYNIGDIQKDAESLAKQVNKNWSKVALVSVGNEVLRQGQTINGAPITVGQWLGAVSAAKQSLKANGYNGRVTVVEEAGAMMENTALCGNDVDDKYVTVNAHAFFDGQQTPAQAGPFVKMIADKVSAACGGKTVVVTETGWPSAGGAIRASVPSPSNQATAIESIKKTFSSNCFIFSAFNEEWKPNVAGVAGVEQTWGFLN